MRRLGAIAFLIWGHTLSAQSDTLALQAVEVLDYAIEANGTAKQQKLQVDSLAQLGRYNLGQVLQTQTPIFVKTYGNNGVATLSFRGSGSNHTRVFWNNLDISSPSLGLADLSTLPALAFDQANVQYGAASLSDGSGALGGSVRLGSSNPVKGPFSLQFDQMQGSFGQWQSVLGVSGLKNKWRYQSKAYYFTAANDFEYLDITQAPASTGQLKNSRLQQQGLLQEIEYRFNAHESLSLKGWYNQTDRQLPPPITGNLESYDSLHDRQLSAIAQYQHQKGSTFLMANSGWVQSQNDFYLAPFENGSLNRYHSWQNNVRLKHRFGPAWAVEGGLRYRNDAVDTRNYQQQQVRHTTSAFADVSRNFAQKWRAHLLLRQELINDFFSPLMGSLGLLYKATEHHRLKASLARNFRYPTLNDWYWQPGGNPNLRPEESWQAEASYAYQSGAPGQRHYLNWELTFFTARIDNWIQWVPFENFTRPQNLRLVQNTGLEIKYKSHWFWGPVRLTQSANYGYTRSQTLATYGSGEKAQQLAYVPFQRANLGLGAALKQWQLLYHHSFTDRYFTTASNNVYMPAFHWAQISLQKKDLLNSGKHKLQATLTIMNLYDYDYQVLPYRPEPGLHYNLLISYQLGS